MARPTLRQLEYAVALAEERHFGRAARRCAVTQPALSEGIRELEETLGAALFERTRRGVLLTPVGEAALTRAREALRAADEMVHAARGVGGVLRGPLHLGVIPTIAPFLLPRWLPAVRRAHPELLLFLHEDKTDRIAEQLRDGRLDLVLLALPLEAPDLHEEALFDEPFLLAAPRDHRLARGRRRLRQSDLKDESVLLLEDGHCLRDQALEVCQTAGARESALARAASLSTLVQMVQGGLGVTLLPESAVGSLVRPGDDVVVRPFAPPPPRRTLGLAWRRTAARASDFRTLAALLRQT